MPETLPHVELIRTLSIIQPHACLHAVVEIADIQSGRPQHTTTYHNMTTYDNISVNVLGNNGELLTLKIGNWERRPVVRVRTWFVQFASCLLLFFQWTRVCRASLTRYNVKYIRGSHFWVACGVFGLQNEPMCKLN